MSHGKTVVVGAGLAGLSAARSLAAAGHDVEIVEARDRIGGRVHTVDGIDLGAHWIHGTEGNPITDLARRLQLPTLFVGGDATYVGGWAHMALYRAGGHRLSDAEKARSILAADAVQEAIERWRGERDRDDPTDLSLADVVAAYAEAENLSPDQLALAAWHLTLLAREDWSGGLERLSALSWDTDYEVFGSGDSILLGGYQQLAEKLAHGLRIRTASPVLSIEHARTRGASVLVHTATGTIECDRVIVTVPIGVLKAGSIHFDPPLSDRKRAAIERLGVGSLAKLVLWFEQPFWPEDVYTFGLLDPEDSSLSPTTAVSASYTHGIPCLVLLAGGELGVRVEALSDAEAVAWGIGRLGKLFGMKVPAPTRHLRTNWTLDPYARGSYSFVAVGSTPDDIGELGRPESDGLFFAGEATNAQHWSCTHSAYLSGLREAARINGEASILPRRHFTESRRRRDQMLRLSRFLDLRTRELGEAEIAARVDVLRSSDVFASLVPTELRLLASMLEERWLAPGQALCRHGEHATDVFVVADGCFAIQSRDGASLGSAERGTVVGEYGLFAAMTRQATVVAETEGRVLSLDYPRFARFLDAFPEAMRALMRITVERFVVRKG
jgi:monoamine oxidase